MRMYCLLAVIASTFLTSCSDVNKPSGHIEPIYCRRFNGFGKLFGESGASIYAESSECTANLRKSGYEKNKLFQSVLDELEPYPLASSDSESGVALTDWIQNPSDESHRAKIMVRICARDGKNPIHVQVFDQIKDSQGQWGPQTPNKNRSTIIQNSIIQRASK